MDTGDIILVIAVVVSLLIGVGSIIHNGRMQRKQQRHTEQIQRVQIQHDRELRERERWRTLLSETIEWATAVLDVEFGRDVDFARTISSISTSADKRQALRSEAVYLADKLFRYQAVSIRGVMVVKVAEIFGKDLQTAAVKVMTCLTALRESINSQSDSAERLKDQALSEEVDSRQIELRNSATTLLQWATSINVEEMTLDYDKRTS